MNKLLIAALPLCLLGGCITVHSHEPSYAVQGQVGAVDVDEYYVMDGHYYYWHPHEHRYMEYHGNLPHGRTAVRVEHLPDRR